MNGLMAESAAQRTATRVTLPMRDKLFSPTVQVALLMTLAALCAFVFIGRQHLSLDEADSEGYAQQGWATLWSAIHHTDAPQALYYAFLHMWFAVGNSVSVLRVPCALAFVATIPFAYGIARKLYGNEVAVITGALLATSSFAVNQGADNLRPYAFALCFATIATYAFILSVEAPRWRHLLLYAASAAAAIYFHLFAGFLVIGHLVSLPVLTKLSAFKIRRFGVAYIAMGLLCIPLVYMLHVTGTHQISWVPRPRTGDLARVFVTFSGSKHVAILFEGLAVAGIVLGWRRATRPQTLAAVIWVCVPIVVAYGISLVIPMFVSKYLIVILVPFLLLVARGIAGFQKPALVAAVTVVVVGLSLRLVWVARHAPGPHDGYPPAAAYLQAHSVGSDAVVVISPGPYYAYRSAVAQLRDRPQAPVIFPPHGWQFWLPGQRFRVPTPNEISNYDRVWLVLTDPPPLLGNAKADRASIESGMAGLKRTFGSFRTAQIVDYSGVSLVQLQRCSGGAPQVRTPLPRLPAKAAELSRALFATTCSDAKHQS